MLCTIPFSTDEKIVLMAKRYIKSPDATIRSVAKEYGIGASTLQNYFANRLKDISPDLYKKVEKKKNENISRVRKNFIEPEKSSILKKISKIFHKNKK